MLIVFLGQSTEELTYRPVKPAIVIWVILDMLPVMGKILYMNENV
jgi:hypothetical protein